MNLKTLTLFGRVKVKIQYRSNGRKKSDDFKTGTISNYRVGLETI